MSTNTLDTTQRAIDQRAFRLMHACETAVKNAGGRIIYDAELLDESLCGCLVPDRGGHRTIIVSDAYQNMTAEAVFMAHEAAHFFDPALIRFGDRYPNEFEQNRGETVAHAASGLLISYFDVGFDMDMSWIENRIAQHTARDKHFTSSRSFFRRVDAAAMAILPTEGHEWLRSFRRSPEQPRSGIPLTERLSGKAKEMWAGWADPNHAKPQEAHTF